MPIFNIYRGDGSEGTAAPTSSSYCRWCSNDGLQVIHYGPCPRVKSIEYHPNGNIKRVEFVKD